MPPEITVAQMQEIERHAEADFGLTPETLMENAGRTVAAFLLEEMKPKGLVSILAGNGHNGGDGLVAARYLQEAGTAVEIVQVEPDNLQELTRKQREKTRELGIAEADFPDEETTLIVDCLLGYGANGCPSERISDLIIVANALNVPKLAVDIPTGFEVGTNTWYPPFFARATLLTLALPKINLLKNPYIKTIWLGDIGIPLELYKQMEIKNPPRFTEKPYMKILG